MIRLEMGSMQGDLPDRMLQLLERGGLHSTAELARRLGAAETLITALAETLTRQGYLAAIAAGCETSCSGCWAMNACDRSSSTPMLALTAKGHQAARRQRGSQLTD